MGSARPDASYNSNEEDSIKIKEEKTDNPEHSAMDRNGDKNGHYYSVGTRRSGPFDGPSPYQFGMFYPLIDL